jgi:hypothetical protein
VLLHPPGLLARPLSAHSAAGEAVHGCLKVVPSPRDVAAQSRVALVELGQVRVLLELEEELVRLIDGIVSEGHGAKEVSSGSSCFARKRLPPERSSCSGGAQKGWVVGEHQKKAKGADPA